MFFMGFNVTRDSAVMSGGIRELTRTALFVALLAVSGYLSFPLPFSPVPVTAQTIVLNVIALSFPPKRTFKTIAVYIAAGTAGLPIFAMGSSGLGVLMGPAGGYLWGFLAAAVSISMLKQLRRGRGGFAYYLLITLAGIPVIYLLGVSQMAFVLSLDISRAFALGAMPFIPGDIFKCAAAAFMALAAEKAVSR